MTRPNINPYKDLWAEKSSLISYKKNGRFEENYLGKIANKSIVSLRCHYEEACIPMCSACRGWNTVGGAGLAGTGHGGEL
jgi:hypothetical protein